MVVDMIHNKSVKIFNDIVHLLELDVKLLMFAKSSEQTYVPLSNSFKTSNFK